MYVLSGFFHGSWHALTVTSLCFASVLCAFLQLHPALWLHLMKQNGGTNWSWARYTKTKFVDRACGDGSDPYNRIRWRNGSWWQWYSGSKLQEFVGLMTKVSKEGRFICFCMLKSTVSIMPKMPNSECVSLHYKFREWFLWNAWMPTLYGPPTRDRMVSIHE